MLSFCRQPLVCLGHAKRPCDDHANVLNRLSGLPQGTLPPDAAVSHAPQTRSSKTSARTPRRRRDPRCAFAARSQNPQDLPKCNQLVQTVVDDAIADDDVHGIVLKGQMLHFTLFEPNVTYRRSGRSSLALSIICRVGSTPSTFPSCLPHLLQETHPILRRTLCPRPFHPAEFRQGCRASTAHFPDGPAGTRKALHRCIRCPSPVPPGSIALPFHCQKTRWLLLAHCSDAVYGCDDLRAPSCLAPCATWQCPGPMVWKACAGLSCPIYYGRLGTAPLSTDTAYWETDYANRLFGTCDVLCGGNTGNGGEGDHAWGDDFLADRV